MLIIELVKSKTTKTKVMKSYYLIVIIIRRILFGTILLIIFTCTILHIWRKLIDKNVHQIVQSFSIYSNACSILNLENTGGTNELKFLHGLRVIALFWIVLSHTCIQAIWPVPAINSHVIMDWLKNPLAMIILAASPATDIFFIVSAMLLTSKVFRELDKT